MTIESSMQRFTQLSAALVSDVLRAAGAPHQVLHSSIQQLVAGPTLVGPAFCVRGERVLGGVPKRAGPNPRYEMYRRVAAGDVVVIESGGYEDAVMFGENIAHGFAVRKCAGIVTDGGIRDRRAMDDLHMPVFGSFVTPLSSGGQWSMTELQTPLKLKGQSSSYVTIYPGDIIVADSDGVVVIPLAALDTVLEDTERLFALEQEVSRGLAAGRDPGEVFQSVDRTKHIRRIDSPT